MNKTTRKSRSKNTWKLLGLTLTSFNIILYNLLQSKCLIYSRESYPPLCCILATLNLVNEMHISVRSFISNSYFHFHAPKAFSKGSYHVTRKLYSFQHYCIWPIMYRSLPTILFLGQAFKQARCGNILQWHVLSSALMQLYSTSGQFKIQNRVFKLCVIKK